jgi:ribosomal protein S18 acetylase RimI-like enzyme
MLGDYERALIAEVGSTTLIAERATLPAPYAPPGGLLLLARDEGGKALGCVGVRPQSETECEIKRLYVRPDARGVGLGRALVRAAIDGARAMGYGQMVLVAIEGTTEHAQRIYRDLCFTPTPPFRSVTGECTGPGFVFMRRAL